jgi:hypothetical protein
MLKASSETGSNQGMQTQKVESTMLKAVGYDGERKLLEIVFRDGESVQYFGVPKRSYTSLMSASSKGRYVRDVVLNQYPCEVITA